MNPLLNLLTDLRLLALTPEQMMEERVRMAAATVVVPVYLANVLRSLGLTVTELVDFGCGVVPKEAYTHMRLSLKKVHLVDPRAEIIPTDVQTTIEFIINGPVVTGLPAIACHAGFSMGPRHHEEITDVPVEPWEETLTRWAPTVLAHCSFCDDEMMEDLQVLQKIGYKTLQIIKPEKIRRDFKFVDERQSGCGYCMAVSVRTK